MNEYCIYFPALSLDIGTLPASYMIARGELERNTATDAGGIDVSSDQHSWELAEQSARHNVMEC